MKLTNVLLCILISLNLISMLNIMIVTYKINQKIDKLQNLTNHMENVAKNIDEYFKPFWRKNE